MAKTFKSSPGTWLERDLFESQAYLALRGFAPQLLTLLLGKRQFERRGKTGRETMACINCDSLVLTYVEAENKYGITKPRLTRAYDELLAKGFLTCKHQGGGYKQDKSLYGLIEKWRLWKPGLILEERKRDTVQRGFCKPKREAKVIHGAF
jgi:hypothetical protein